MDCQARNECHRLTEIHQGVPYLAVFIQHRHPTGQGKIPVKPGIQQHTTVNFDTQLKEALAAELRVRLDLQAGAVGMSTHHADSRGGDIFAAGSEGDN